MAVIGGAPLKTVLSLAQLCAEGQGAYSLPSLKRAIVNYGGEIDTKDSANIKLISSGESFEVRSIYGQPGPMTDCTVKLCSCKRWASSTNTITRRFWIAWSCRSATPLVTSPGFTGGGPAQSSGAFAFLRDPAEDIYTAADGEPFRDAP